MSMNINSISELPNIASISPAAITSLYSSPGDSDDTIRANFKPIAEQLLGTGSEISDMNSNLNFDGLSCSDMFVEVSYGKSNGLSSLKFNLGEALTKLAKTVAWVASLNMNALTESRANKLYVPYSGNLGEDDFWISGLKIMPPADVAENTFAALSIDGGVYVGTANTGNSNTVFQVRPNLDIPTIEILNNAKFVATGNTACEINNLTATNCDSTKLSATNLSVNNLRAGRYSNTSWNVRLDSTNIQNGQCDTAILNVTKMATTSSDITSLRADNLCASLNGATYRLSAVVGGLAATNLSATECKAVNLSSTKLSAYELSAGINGNIVNLEVPYTGEINVNALIANNFKAGGSQHDIVTLSSDSTALEVTNLRVTNTGTIANCDATSLKAGIKANNNILLQAISSDTHITLSKLLVNDADGLSANGISQLTAKAACWS